MSERRFFSDIYILLKSLPRKRKFQLLGLFILQILSALSEVVSIGAIIPFLSALTDITSLMQNPKMEWVLVITGITEENQLIMLLAALFAITIIIANILRFATLWVQLHLSAAIATDFGAMLFQKTLSQPYTYFLNNNSSELIGNMTNDLNGTLGVLHGLLTMTTQGIMTVSIVTALLIFNAPVALALSVITFLAYTIITLVIKARLFKNSKIISDNYRYVLKSLQEGFGGIRYVALHKAQPTFVNYYEYSDRLFRSKGAENSVIRQAPRFFVESIGVVAMCAFAISIVAQNKEISHVIPLLGFLAMASYRMLPAVQQVFSSLSAMLGLVVSLRRTVSILSCETPSLSKLASRYEPLVMQDKLLFKDVWFRYEGMDEDSWTLKKLNFSIDSKMTVAFIGQTGSGKSTIADLILGLISPTKGIITADDKQLIGDDLWAWQSGIAHVPQDVFLMDASIYENIAFGIKSDQIDFDRVKEVAKLAQIHDFINTLPQKYEEMVGERGVRLSGGQLQRIGIARALYNRPSVILFDEATSALDGNTEKEVMSAIDDIGKEVTIIIIAHRISTVEKADKIFILDKGSIVEQGNYNELLKKSSYFKKLVRGGEI